MNNQVIKTVTAKMTEKSIPEIRAGYTVEVDTIIRDGDKSRIQKFKGLVIAVKGTGVTKSIVVRKVSYGVGVEKYLPVYSPNVGAIKVIKKEPVRRSKLYFMRDRVGKSAMRVRKGRTVMVPQENAEEAQEEVMPVENTAEETK